jgi:hypothetical protein
MQAGATRRTPLRPDEPIDRNGRTTSPQDDEADLKVRLYFGSTVICISGSIFPSSSVAPAGYFPTLRM